eukprot:CAMPEP_0196687098 /NCGR_PEP_ID=MMETSP1090-20130531/14192_1 /TAXON_ID=37098 /ORGANISM="Isochrysis sp, Strain CCMP1244" /LENGTH=80 /DNA_ID=CAMNT_0042025859 /DNA_START=16 /DNA_END=256 /DNA_ORIENTATION=+
MTPKSQLPGKQTSVKRDAPARSLASHDCMHKNKGAEAPDDAKVPRGGAARQFCFLHGLRGERTVPAAASSMAPMALRWRR